MLIFFMTRTFLIIIFSLFFVVPAAFSDIHKYTDEDGVICYTDAPFGKKTEVVIKENQTSSPENKTVTKSNYTHFVKQAALKYEIEPELINAVIKTESNGNHRAVSKKGAKGLMQLMPTTANDMNVRNVFNPEENIDGGTKYLKYLLEKFKGNLTLALAAYNSGPKTVEKYGAVPPISETVQYVKKVFSLYKGKQNYNLSTSSDNALAKPAPIYKVLLDDGTILFTNSVLGKKEKVRF